MLVLQKDLLKIRRLIKREIKIRTNSRNSAFRSQVKSHILDSEKNLVREKAKVQDMSLCYLKAQLNIINKILKAGEHDLQKSSTSLTLSPLSRTSAIPFSRGFSVRFGRWFSLKAIEHYNFDKLNEQRY